MQVVYPQEMVSAKVVTINSTVQELYALLVHFPKNLVYNFRVTRNKYVVDAILLGSIDTQFHADTYTDCITLHFSGDAASEEVGHLLKSRMPSIRG